MTRECFHSVQFQFQLLNVAISLLKYTLFPCRFLLNIFLWMDNWTCKQNEGIPLMNHAFQ